MRSVHAQSGSDQRCAPAIHPPVTRASSAVRHWSHCRPPDSAGCWPRFMTWARFHAFTFSCFHAAESHASKLLSFDALTLRRFDRASRLPRKKKGVCRQLPGTSISCISLISLSITSQRAIYQTHSIMQPSNIKQRRRFLLRGFILRRRRCRLPTSGRPNARRIGPARMLVTDGVDAGWLTAVTATPSRLPSLLCLPCCRFVCGTATRSTDGILAVPHTCRGVVARYGLVPQTRWGAWLVPPVDAGFENADCSQVRRRRHLPKCGTCDCFTVADNVGSCCQ